MLVDQAEIHRRIRAAMLLARIKDWEELAARTGYSRTTVKDLGTTRRYAERKHLIAVSVACGVPYEWFTVPSIPEAVRWAATSGAAGDDGAGGLPDLPPLGPPPTGPDSTGLDEPEAETG